MKAAKWCVLAGLVLSSPGIMIAAEVQQPRKTNADDSRAIAPEQVGEDTWKGPLVDLACKEQHVDHTCPVTAKTERFGLVGDGGIILAFDDAGNQKAKQAVGKADYIGNIEVTAVGKLEGSTFRVRSLHVDQ